MKPSLTMLNCGTKHNHGFSKGLYETEAPPVSTTATLQQWLRFFS